MRRAWLRLCTRSAPAGAALGLALGLARHCPCAVLLQGANMTVGLCNDKGVRGVITVARCHVPWCLCMPHVAVTLWGWGVSSRLLQPSQCSKWKDFSCTMDSHVRHGQACPVVMFSPFRASLLLFVHGYSL